MKWKETKFRLKIYLLYLVVEPWTSELSLPNLRTISWTLIFISLFLKIFWLQLTLLIMGLLLYLFYEFKQGQYLGWYRQRKFKEKHEALKKVREKRRNNEILKEEESKIIPVENV
jgi:hypothetical protein